MITEQATATITKADKKVLKETSLSQDDGIEDEIITEDNEVEVELDSYETISLKVANGLL